MAERILIGRGQVSIHDLTDSRTLVAYLGSTLARQVIFDPNTDTYSPNYNDEDMELVAELYIAGDQDNKILQAKEIKWYKQDNSRGELEEIVEGNTYKTTEDSLLIRRNVLEDKDTMTYQARIVYPLETPEGEQEDMVVKADIVLIKISSGAKGDSGSDGVGIVDITEMYLTTDLSTGVTKGTDGWSETVQEITTEKRYLWNYEIIEYTNGAIIESTPAVIGVHGIHGEHGEDGVGIESIKEKYLASSEKTGVTVETSGWTDTVQIIDENKRYLWNYEIITYTNGSTQTMEPVVLGSFGHQGIPGQDGKDGLNSYTHIAYADSSDGEEGFTFDRPEERIYMGMYVSNVSQSSDDPSDYRWTKVRGEDGRDGQKGTPGEPGEDGRTPYFHIAYANSEDGKEGFSTHDSEDKLYIGQYTDYEEMDSEDPSRYSWTRFKGDAGTDGIGIQSVTEKYLATDKSEGITVITPGWTEDVQTISEDKRFLWNYETITYSNGESESSKPVILGVHGLSGAVGNDGVGIESVTEYYLATSKSDGITKDTSGWTESIQTITNDKKYLWNYEVITFTDNSKRESDPVILGVYGPQGLPGKDGEDGQSSYTHIAYANNSSGSSGFTFDASKEREYIGVLVNTSPSSSSDYRDYNWTKFRGNDGKDGSDGAPGKPGEDGKTPYFHVAYSNSSDGKKDFSTSNSEDKLYIGQYTDFTQADSTDYTKYTWTRIKGDKGDRGQQGYPGVDGKDGEDGVSSYTHIAYANNSSGSNGFTFDESLDRIYMGVYVDTNITSSEDLSKYRWTKVRGDDGIDGNDGVPGAPGEDGKTPYFHTAYANSSDGTKDFSRSNSTDKIYIGQYTDYTSSSSTDPSKYRWSKIRGEDSLLSVLNLPEGDTIRNHENNISIEVTLYKGASTVTPTDIRWYQLDPSASGDSHSGAGWRKLMETGETLTVTPEMFSGTGTYLSIVTYDGKNYKNTTTVKDLVDTSVSIIGPNVFRNGKGTITLTAKVYSVGEEVDTGGTKYTYSWSSYDSFGNLNNEFNKSGKTIEVDADDIDGIADLQCIVTK